MIRRSLLAIALGLGVAAPARAQSSVADFYKDRTIDVYAGYSAGGVYDIFSRMLTRYMGRHIPGNPTMVARNMEGAGGMRLANWLYQLAPKDGTAFGTFGRGTAFDPLLGQSGAAFDATKYGWIGSTNDEVSVCVSWSASGITQFDQLRDRELVVGGTGGGADDELFPKIINGVLGSRLKIISGYPGGNDVKIAIQRGEVSGRCGWSWSSVKATQAQWLKNRDISILLQLSFRKHPDLPDVPLIMDLAKTDEERRIFKLIFARLVMGWPFAAPPGVPADRLAALRVAFDETMTDPDFLKEAERLSLEVRPVSGQQIQELVEELYKTTSPEMAEKIRLLLK